MHSIALPDGSILQSFQACTLNVPGLSKEALVAYLFPELSVSLVSVGPLCDHGCDVTYYVNEVTVRNSNQLPVLRGLRDAKSGLWMVPLGDQPTASGWACALNALPSQATQAQLVAFYHASMGSPAISTLTAAIDDGYIKLPGLSSALVRKYPPDLTATAKDHLDLIRQGLQSTTRPPNEQHIERSCSSYCT